MSRREREGLVRPKRLEWNVCSCPLYIVTIDPPKDTEKYIPDDEVVRSTVVCVNKTPESIARAIPV